MSEEKAVETVVEEKTLLGTESKEVKAEVKEEVKTEVKTEEKKETSLYDKEGKEVTQEKKEEVKTEVKADEVPEKYDIKLKDMELDTKMIEGLSPVFKELKLTNAHVQKLAEAYVPVVKAQVEANQTKAIDDWKKTVDGWKTNTVKALGADYAKELAFAAKVIDRFGDKTKGPDGKTEVNSLRQLFDETGVGNHPALVGALVKVGKLISEDHFAEGSKSSGKGEISLYDHPTSKETLR